MEPGDPNQETAAYRGGRDQTRAGTELLMQHGLQACAVLQDKIAQLSTTQASAGSSPSGPAVTAPLSKSAARSSHVNILYEQLLLKQLNYKNVIVIL